MARSLKTVWEKNRKMKILNSKNPLSDLLRSDLETVFNDSFLNPFNGYRTPLTNISEKGKEITVEMVIPGYKKSDLEISLENNILTVKGKKNAGAESESGKYLQKEFSTQEFSKSFRIDPSVSDESIASKLEDGILTIQIPRAKKIETKKMIAIC